MENEVLWGLLGKDTRQRSEKIPQKVILKGDERRLNIKACCSRKIEVKQTQMNRMILMVV